MSLRSSRARWRIVFGSFLLGGVAIACGPGFLDGISGGTKAVEETPETGAPAEAGPTCNSRLVPEPPGGADSPDNVQLPTFALDTLRSDTFGKADAGGAVPVGLDMDRTCTCPQAPSCKNTFLGSGDAGCDGPRGEDNALSSLFNSLNVGVPLFPQTFATDRIHKGSFNLLIEIRSWNGKDDDPVVGVTLRTSEFLQADGDGGRKDPLFDGNDVWTVSPESVSAGDAGLGKDCRSTSETETYACLARVGDSQGYVRGRRLVAHPRLDSDPKAGVPLTMRAALGTIRLEVLDLTITADITGDGTTTPYRLAGELTGRLATTELIKGFANLQDFTKADPQPPVCDNPTVFATAKNAVCASADLAAPGHDREGATCDHVSLAMSFTAGPAVVGLIFRKDFPTNPCGDRTYSCQ